MRKKHLGLALICAAVFLAVPVLAEDAVIKDSMDFATMYEDKEDDYYSWDASHKVLTLRDGFRMDVGSNEKDAIVIPGGTMVFVEGNAAIASADDCIFVKCTIPGSVTIILKKDAVLSLHAAGDGIETEGNLSIVGEDRDSSTLRVDAEEYGIVTKKDIHTKDCTVDIDSRKTCMRAFEQGGDDAFEEFQNILVENSILSLRTEAHKDSTSNITRPDPTMHAGKTVTITDSTAVMDSAGMAITATDTSIDITNSSLDITAGKRGINTENGKIRIDSSRIDMIADGAGFSARGDKSGAINTIEITNTSLDVTVISENILFNSDLLTFDDKVVLYGANGRRLTNIPIRYTEDLVVVKSYKTSEVAEKAEDFNHCYFGNTPVHRLVTAADTSIYIEKTLGSMQTVSFSGEGTGALSGLWRAFGSTINLNRYTPAAREGCTFTGWYADAACTKPVTRLVVTGDMELYAGWEEIPAAEEETAETAADAAAE